MLTCQSRLFHGRKWLTTRVQRRLQETNTPAGCTGTGQLSLWESKRYECRWITASFTDPSRFFFFFFVCLFVLFCFCRYRLIFFGGYGCKTIGEVRNTSSSSFVVEEMSWVTTLKVTKTHPSTCMCLSTFCSVDNNWRHVVQVLGLEQWSQCVWHTHGIMEPAWDSGGWSMTGVKDRTFTFLLSVFKIFWTVTTNCEFKICALNNVCYMQGLAPAPRGCHASALLGNKGYISGGVVSFQKLIF